MSGARKTIAKDRGALVNLITKREKTTKQASVNAYRNAFKQLIAIDAEATLNGHKSVLVMLRNEALAVVSKAKRTAKAKLRKARRKK